MHIRRLWQLSVMIVLLSSAMLGDMQRVHAQDCLSGGQIVGCAYGLPIFQYQLLLPDMLAHPSPNVRPLEVDRNEVNRYSFYQLPRQTITFYDAPNGSPVGTLDAGFNYLAVRRREGDWAEVQPGKWIPISLLIPSRASTYTGVLIDQPLARPMAWMLVPVFPSSYPGGEPDANQPRLERYTRLSIFATVKVGDWEWYLVGPGQWVEQRKLARVLPTTKPTGVKGRWVAVDLYEQVLVAYDEDRMVYATLISSGLPKWSTNEGLFRIWARARADSMTGAMGQPDFYFLQSVPYVMYFDNAISLHGTYWHDGFGYRHSHGCVNMSISDARWIFEWTNNFYRDTWVYVWSSGNYQD